VPSSGSLRYGVIGVDTVERGKCLRYRCHAVRPPALKADLAHLVIIARY
jgi:hypothetical protein